MDETGNIKELSAEEFLSGDNEPVLMPYDIENKGRIWIRKITNLEFRKWATRVGKDDENDVYNDAALIQLCVCDKSGKRLFKVNQIPRIASVFEDIILPLSNACAEFNGVGAEAERNIAKNSGQTPGDDFSSGSEVGTD